MNSEVKIQAYNSGYRDGLRKGRMNAALMKEDADGCIGCIFEDVEAWELPCSKCTRNCKDYWRAKNE